MELVVRRSIVVFILAFGTPILGCGEDVIADPAIDISDDLDLGDDNARTDAASPDAITDDAGEFPADAALDAASDDSGSPEDAGNTPAPASPLHVTAELSDGTFASGEIVAVYDRTRWWNPGTGGLVYALFDPDRYEFSDADRSFTFVYSDDVTRLVAQQPVELSYREFLRERGFEFDRNPLGERAYVVMGNDGYHLDEDGYGDFAYDLQLTDDQGRRFTGNGAQNTDHLVWDAPAYAPIGGTVFEVVESGVDQTPGSYPDGAVNNLVGIHLGGNFYAYLLHFRQDGVDSSIVPGTRIEPGTRLGRVGNSGVTLEPHLHLVLLWFNPSETRSYSVPAAFSSIEQAPTPRGPWQVRESAIPDTGVWIR